MGQYRDEITESREAIVGITCGTFDVALGLNNKNVEPNTILRIKI